MKRTADKSLRTLLAQQEMALQRFFVPMDNSPFRRPPQQHRILNGQQSGVEIPSGSCTSTLAASRTGCSHVPTRLGDGRSSSLQRLLKQETSLYFRVSGGACLPRPQSYCWFHPLAVT